ncbi:MAG: hypothetical protein J6I98_03500 [Clostridia bacterium]|nr:hypothetical protein [Clostridia bacterium]
MSKKAAKGRARRGAGRKKKRLGGWIFWAVLTALNLVLSLAMRIADRKMAVAAIQQDEKFSLLYTGEKTTKTL